jgi:toxin ParE1/3/4
MKVVWRAQAEKDLIRICAAIVKHSPSGAARIHGRILDLIGKLADWPDMGRPGRAADLRELVATGTPYLILYRRLPDKIIVLRIVHGKRLR